MSNGANVWEPKKILAISGDTKSATQKFVAIQGQEIFNLTAYVYAVGTEALEVHKNGLLLVRGADWIEQSESKFILLTPAVAGDVIVATAHVGIEGNVDVRDTDIFLPNYQSLRDYAGTEDTIYLKSRVAISDGGEDFFRLVTGAAIGTYVDDNDTTIVPTGGNGSSAWLRSVQYAGEWQNKVNVTYVSDNSFKMTGDYSDIYTINRRVNIDDKTAYSTITDSIFAGGETTVTLSDNVVTVGIVSVQSAISGVESAPHIGFKSFKSSAEMKATLLKFASMLNDGDRVEWQGYYSQSDGGSNWGVVRFGAHTDDGGSIFSIDANTYIQANMKGSKISVKKFGAKGDDVHVDDPFINKALATGLHIYGPKGTYRCEDTLEVTGDFSGVGIDTLYKFYGSNISPLVNKLVTGSYDNFSVDGDNVDECQYGIYCEADYEPIREEYNRLTVTNVKSTATSCNGIILVRFSDDLAVRGNFYFNKCVVKGISGSSVAKGIIVSFNNDSQSNVTIKSPDVQDVTPATDGDAIHITTAAHTNPLLNNYHAVITNAYVKSSLPMKRGIKIQWHNAKVSNSLVIGDNITIGYDIYSAGGRFNANTYIEHSSGQEAFNCFDAQDLTISDFNATMHSSVSQCMRFKGNSKVKLNHSNIGYKGVAIGDTLGIIQVEDSAELIADDIDIIADNKEGCGILQGGTSKVKLNNSTIDGPKFGIRDNFGSGSCELSGKTEIKGVEFGFQAFGTSGFTFDVSDSNIEASSIGIYSQSSGNYAKIKVKDSTILTESNGILGHDDDVVDNCHVENTSAQSGVGILTKDRGRISNNKIVNFATAMQYTNAVDTEIHGNVDVDCATQFIKSGAVDFVFYENNSR